MIVFIDTKFIHHFVQSEKILFIPIDISFLEKNIYAWKNLDKTKIIMNSDIYKNLLENRIKNGHPENIYSEYNCINHAKIDFINYALPFIKTSFICWSDFGYHSSILNNEPSLFPTNTLDINLFNIDLINTQIINKIGNYDPIDTLVNGHVTFTGSFYGLPKKLVPSFQELYHTCLEELYSMGISDDDQHVLFCCFNKKPELFDNKSFNSWPNSLTYFQKTNLNLDKNLDRYSLVKKYIKNSFNVIEIGTDNGDFAEFILNNSNCNLYCIDPYISYDEYNDGINNKTGDLLFTTTQKRLNLFGKRIKMIRKFSHDALNDINEQIDFIYIDGNHSYKYVLQDLVDWYPKLKMGGVIIGDDAVDTPDLLRKNDNVFIDWGYENCYGNYGVIKAFEEFSKIVNCESYKVGNQYVLLKK